MGHRPIRQGVQQPTKLNMHRKAKTRKEASPSATTAENLGTPSRNAIRKGVELKAKGQGKGRSRKSQRARRRMMVVKTAIKPV